MNIAINDISLKLDSLDYISVAESVNASLEDPLLRNGPGPESYQIW